MLYNPDQSLAYINLPDNLDDCFTDPVFWFGIGCPAIILLTLALVFLWLDYKVWRLK